MKHMYYIFNSSVRFFITVININNLITRFSQHKKFSSSLNREILKDISQEFPWFNWVMNYSS